MTLPILIIGNITMPSSDQDNTEIRTFVLNADKPGWKREKIRSLRGIKMIKFSNLVTSYYILISLLTIILL